MVCLCAVGEELNKALETVMDRMFQGSAFYFQRQRGWLLIVFSWISGVFKYFRLKMNINGASLIIGRKEWKPINSWKRQCLVDLKVFAINFFFWLVLHVVSLDITLSLCCLLLGLRLVYVYFSLPQSTRWDYRNERTTLLGDRTLPRTTPVHSQSTNLLQNTKRGVFGWALVSALPEMIGIINWWR